MGNQEIDYRLLSMIIGNSRYLFAENSAHDPDKIAESIKENITSDSPPKDSTTVGSRQLLVPVADNRSRRGSGSLVTSHPLLHQLVALGMIVVVDMMGR
jgi:hypothetical protein